MSTHSTLNFEHVHIQINLGIKSQFKLTILIFWTKFAQTGCFQSKKEKNEQCH